jgi:hypothetical protein
MAVPKERQIQIVVYGIGGTRHGQLSRKNAAAKG